MFDSGFGGLTVLRALLARIPSAEFFYIGDTARLPYGSKSRATVARYAVESARLLESYGAQYLVIACNTASALALDEVNQAAGVPVIGVVETGADAAAATSKTCDVLVLATEATIQSHAYAAACTARGLRSVEKACPLLVPLIEEGWVESENDNVAAITRRVVNIYLDEAFAEAKRNAYSIDTVLLGCTHYPLLRPMLEVALPSGVNVLDSAETTAERVCLQLSTKQLATLDGKSDEPVCHFFATDSVEKFRRLGSRFLGRPLDAVELIDLG